MEQYVLSKEEMQYLGYYTEPDGHIYATNESETKTIWFMDCEMVETTLGLEVAIIGFGKAKDSTDKTYTIYDKYDSYSLKVEPKGAIINYMTHITGLTHWSCFDMTYEQGIEFMLKHIMKDDIIVGHHLYNDMKALNMYHQNIIDCCMIFYHPDGPPSYYSLKELTATYLKQHIQNREHDPIEDGTAAYNLVKLCIDNGYVKTHWQKLEITFNEHIFEHISFALGSLYKFTISILNTQNKSCVYGRDYNVIVILDEKKVINGTIIRYGNINITLYDIEYFYNMINNDIIWIIETIYYSNASQYISFYNKHRKDNIESSNIKLRQSIGYESSRKISLGKKYFMKGNIQEAIMQTYTGIQYIESAQQIVMHNYIYKDDILYNKTRNCFKNIDIDIDKDKYKTYDEFKKLWYPLYHKIYKEFNLMVPKIKDTQHTYMFPACRLRKNFNIKMHILKIIQRNEESKLIEAYPEYKNYIDKVKNELKEFTEKMDKIYMDIINIYKERKDFAKKIKEYDSKYHKYLFSRYDNINPYLFFKSLNVKRLYADLENDKAKDIKSTKRYDGEMTDRYDKYSDNIKKWNNEQNEKAKQVILDDVIDMKKIKYVGGLDISFDKSNDTIGVSYITIYDLQENKIVYEDHMKVSLTVPYISGYLGFREVPTYIDILKKVQAEKPEFYPQILMIDGFGILHYRAYGSASQLGIEASIPTIGVGKTLLNIDGLVECQIKDRFRKECKNVGDYIKLIGDSGKVHGVAYKSSKDILNPIYISIGHMISLESCIDIVKRTTKYRIPEPIRNSDIKSKHFL